jgi:lantibiotic biosynthesis protein
MNIKNKWSCPLDGKCKAMAEHIAHDVSGRLSNRDVLAKAVAASSAQCEHFCWNLSEFTGLAMVSSYLDSVFPGANFDTIAHEQLVSAIATNANFCHASVSMYGGLSGLGLAAHNLSRNGSRYKRLLANIDATVNRRAFASIAQLQSPRVGISFTDYDSLYGISGVAAYLLTRSHSGIAQPSLNAILRALVRFTYVAEGGLLSGTPKSLLTGHFAEDPLYEYGLVNCGLAHGVPGPLAILSLARSQGFIVEGMDDAIGIIADWLLANSMQDRWGFDWPAAIALDEAGQCLPAINASRAGWCYGSPGVARSLWLAGDALKCSKYQEQAVAIMEASIKRLGAGVKSDSLTFCHGLAGLLQIVLRFYNNVDSEFFLNASRLLFDRLVSFYDPSSLLGFREIVGRDRPLDSPRIIDGAAGISLALVAATHSAEPCWDRMFMLS